MFIKILMGFLRKIGKGDAHSLINLAGLSVGIATCLMIFLYISDELSYDRHNEHAPQVYRLLQHYPQSGGLAAIQPGIMYRFIEGRVPGVSNIARIHPISECVITIDDEPFTEYDFALADPDIFDILTFEFVAGDPETALSDAHSLLLTQSAAGKYFGDEDPMGKTVIFNNSYSMVVSGIIKDLPSHSHLDFTMLANVQSMETLNPSALNNWANAGQFYYLKIEPDADPDLIAENITSLLWDANEIYVDRVKFELQPLLDVRLFSQNVDWDIASKGDIYVVLIFSATAILILFLACFNFVNLSTASAIKRSMEVGVRKVLGANRGQLIRQFLFETFIFTFFAMLIALLLVEILLPVLNNLSGKQMTQQFIGSPDFALAVLGLLIVIPIFAGFYPALIMSRFKAITAIKGGSIITSVRGIRNKFFQLKTRQVLLLLQFAVSIALIVASLMIYSQMRFLTNQSPGYDPENLIYIKNPWDSQSSARAVWLRDQLLQHPDVENVSLTHNVPTVRPNNYANFSYESDDGEKRMHAAVISCDTELFKTLGTRLLQGRNFSPEMQTDIEMATVINQTAATRMGVEDPIGMMLSGFYDGKPRQVIGVVEDVHFTSMHDAVTPMAFFISHENYPQNWFNLLVRYKDGRSSAVMEYLDNIWTAEAPQWPLNYSFIDQRLESLYQDDKRVMNIVGSFAGLAIFLSTLGLIGLAMFAANARTREIGIRKVLGSGIRDIIKLISSEFAMLALIANLLALPAAWYFINRWLENFAYRADTNWLIFIIPAVLVYLVVWAVVGLISYRAATMNPTDTIRIKG